MPIALKILGLATIVALVSSCASTSSSPSSDDGISQVQGEVPAQLTGEMAVTVCKLPPRLVRIGKLVYPELRRPLKISRWECKIRGGENVDYDRASLSTALSVWQELADKDDPEAQNNVGEIYARGLGQAPDYTRAAQWFRKAADQGYAAAQINLGFLYERGYGVKQDMTIAMNWYRSAQGLEDDVVVMTTIDAEALETRADRADELRTRNRTLEQQLQRANIQRSEAERALVTIESDINALREKQQNTRSQIGSAQSDIKDRDAQIAQLQSELATTTEQAKQELLSEKIKRNQVELELIEERIRTRESSIVAIDEQIKGKQSQADVKRQEQTRLATESRQKEQAIAKVQQEAAQTIGPRIEILDPPFAMLATRGTPTLRLRSPAPNTLVNGRVTAPAGLVTLNVDGEPIDVKTDGLFQIALDQVTQETPVQVVALDKKGRRSVLDFVVAPQIGVTQNNPGIDPNVNPPKDYKSGYHALIIGNNEYQNYSALKTAVNDADAVARVLRDRFGFQTNVLTNVTRDDFYRAFDSLRKRLTPDDKLLIYYAGHGRIDIDNRGYWLPVDAGLENAGTWFSNREITDQIDAIAARQVLVVADSCYSGSFAKNSASVVATLTDPDKLQRYLKRIATKRSRTVITSGGLLPVLDEGGGSNHSVFAEAFLNTLLTSNRVTPGFDLFKKVQSSVRVRASELGFKQVPEYASIQNANHEGGQFVFFTDQNRAMNILNYLVASVVNTLR